MGIWANRNPFWGGGGGPQGPTLAQLAPKMQGGHFCFFLFLQFFCSSRKMARRGVQNPRSEESPRKVRGRSKFSRPLEAARSLGPQRQRVSQGTPGGIPPELGTLQWFRQRPPYASGNFPGPPGIPLGPLGSHGIPWDPWGCPRVPWDPLLLRHPGPNPYLYLTQVIPGTPRGCQGILGVPGGSTWSTYRKPPGPARTPRPRAPPPWDRGGRLQGHGGRPPGHGGRPPGRRNF